MPLATAEMARCLHKTWVPALLNEGPSAVAELQHDRAFQGSPRAGRKAVASAGLPEKIGVMVVKQCYYKLGRCSTPVAPVPLLWRWFWLILWDRPVQVAGKFVGENHSRHGKRRWPISSCISMLLIMANFEVAKMFKTLELFLVEINEQEKYPKVHKKSSAWHF